MEKMFILLRYEYLELFVNPLTTETKYSRHNAGTLLRPIQLHLS